MNGFTFRYAIRMPDGRLYPPPQQAVDPVPDYSVSSAVRDMNDVNQFLGNVFGWHKTPSTELTTSRGPKIFDTRDDAEKQLAELQQAAANIGVTNWGGTIVCQLCTPFTAGDMGQFADQVAAWLRTNGIQS